MNDIRVDSWNELIQVLYDIPKTSHERHRSNFAYRGMADASWKLETSLMRLGGDYVNVEGPLLRNFCKYAESGSLPKASLWIYLAIAQHHGLPTRLMDWTVSPQVAVHFATAEENHFDKDAAIWCVNIGKSRDLLPDTLRNVLRQEYAFLFSVEMLDFISSLKEFDQYRGSNNFLLFFEPPSLDTRIINQSALLSIMSDPALILSDFLQSYPELYHRVIIPKEIKWEVRDKLDQSNVNERMLFPGLDGLSRWLKRYYGPGPIKLL